MTRLTAACSKIGILAEGQTSDMANVLTIQNLLYEPLVRLDSGEIFPALAQSWQVLDNGCRWVFRIRDDARFWDGSDCTAADVIHSLETAKNVTDAFGMPGPFAKYLAGLSFEEAGKKSLVIHSKEPNGDILDFLAEIYIQKPNESASHPLGTGAYQIDGSSGGDELLLKLTGSAAAAGAFDEILFIAIPDAEQRFLALKDGRADIAAEMDEIAPAVGTEDPSGVKWHYAVNTLSVTGFLNGFEAPFNDPNARLAVNYAVDKQKMIREIYRGLAVPAATVVSPYHCGYESTIEPIPYDPDKARELFARCEMPAELTIRTPQIVPAFGEKIAASIREDLEKIGLRVTIDVQTDRPAYAREASQKKIGHLGLFDSSPHSVYRVLQDKISSTIRSTWWQGVSDSEADRLIDEAHAQTDPCQRRYAYAKTLRRLNECPAWLYLVHPINTFASAGEKADNVEITHSGLIRFPGLW